MPSYPHYILKQIFASYACCQLYILFYKVFLFDIKQGTFRLFHFKNAYERDVLPRNSSLQSSDIDKKDQNVFKKARYLFQKVPVVI